MTKETKGNVNKFIPLNGDKILELKKDIIFENKNIYIFDIDETLYPENKEIKDLRRKNYLEFLKEKGFNYEEATKELNMYTEKYGAAIKGILHKYNIDDEIYFKLIKRESLDYKLFQIDTIGSEILNNLTGLKICLTNSDFFHAKLVLKSLGLLDHFDYVFHSDYEDKNFICKPDEGVYHLVELFLGIKKRENVYFFDDKLANVEAARMVGWNGYHVNEKEDYKIILNKLHNKINKPFN
ncbi:pyrimidine 5'-nucleotidase [Anncaliia algerae PRA109]|nr:pyrimidine 5'-nucleotidase [Anncaliia algerae PRA109]